MSSDNIAVLRIELVGIAPLIWRRIAVGVATDLHSLHHIVQAAMGWRNCHLYEFTVVGETYLADPDDADRGHTVFRAGDLTLATVLDSGITAFDYTYDLGDYWEHRIGIERVGPAESKRTYPEFLGGERRCPPEDCGGSHGYYEFLAAIAGPDKGKGSGRKKEMLTWYGDAYDPDDIDEAQIRSALKRIAATA